MSEIIKELRGYNDTHNTNSPQLDDAYAKSQEEYCRTVRSGVKSGRSNQLSGVGIKVRHQPRPTDHRAGAEARGRQQSKARKTGLQPHKVYRRMLQEQRMRLLVKLSHRVLEGRGGELG